VDREAAVRAWACTEFAAVEGNPFAHADQPMAESRRRTGWAAASLVTRLVASFGMYAASWAAVGDRPAPIRPWESVESGLMTPVAGGIVVTVVALLALGLGAAIRSTAGTLVTVTVLIFVVPAMAALLPSPWDERVFGVSLVNLATALAGSADTVLSPVAAAIVAAAYAVIPLGAGAMVLTRRDA
jgi:ABC-2 type transport system permease protein